jgi:hypothetical protein
MVTNGNIKALKAAVLVNNTGCIEAWEELMLQQCYEQGFITGVDIIMQEETAVQGKQPFFLKLYFAFENWWFGKKNFAGTKVKLQSQRWLGERMDTHDEALLKKAGFDIIFNSCGLPFQSTFTTFAKLGVWHIVFGTGRYYQSALPAFWEVMDCNPVTGAHLVVSRKDLPDISIYNCAAVSVPYAVKSNYNSIAWKAASFAAYRLYGLLQLGEKHFFEQFSYASLPGKALQVPGSLQTVSLLALNIFRYFRYKFSKGNEQYRFTVCCSTAGFDPLQPDFQSFRAMKLPAGTFYADPFVADENNKSFVFFECFTNEKGSIAAVTVDAAGQAEAPVTILEQPYHLSYPFLFRHKHEWWMIPETAEAKNVQLYRCTGFPYKWELGKKIMEDIVLIDATVFYYNSKWWMFGAADNHPASTSNDQLLLFFSDHLLEGAWKPHPMNPVATDAGNCRPAGKVFEHHGKLYRPAQNNASFFYGYGICINEIEVISETEYREKKVAAYTPGVNVPYRAIHTVNIHGGITVIDAVM